MKNKFEKLTSNQEEVKNVENNIKVVNLKSEMYNHDNEKIEKREEDSKDIVLWGFIFGFILFLILFILIIIFAS